MNAASLWTNLKSIASAESVAEVEVERTGSCTLSRSRCPDAMSYRSGYGFR